MIVFIFFASYLPIRVVGLSFIEENIPSIIKLTQLKIKHTSLPNHGPIRRFFIDFCLRISYCLFIPSFNFYLVFVSPVFRSLVGFIFGLMGCRGSLRSLRLKEATDCACYLF